MGIGEYTITLPSWLPAGKRYAMQMVIKAAGVEGDPVASDFATRFGVGTVFYDGTNFTIDYAIKLAQSASPIADSSEANIKAALEDTGTTLPFASGIYQDYQQRGQSVTLPVGLGAGEISLSGGYVKVKNNYAV
jgi:hypothetical protein